LGGVAAGSVSLGGRGQLRDWEIFNRPDKGNNLSYALPSIWARIGDAKPVAHVLEARYQPPYEGEDGLGSQNAPGLSRLAGARFTGEFPLARIDFTDDTLPVEVSLEAFSPFIPHEPDDSGLPVAILRYRVKNPNARAAEVAIAWSIDNPVGKGDKRVNEFRNGGELAGLMMTNPSLPDSDVFRGSFALGVMHAGTGRLSHLKGWPAGRWWNSPLLFWDDFTADGELGPEAERSSAVGAVCLQRTIAAGKRRSMSFCWLGIFQTERRRVAAGARRRARRIPSSGTGMPRNSRMRGRRRNTPRRICRGSKSARRCLSTRCARARCRRW
jgi:hypothetical protein